MRKCSTASLRGGGGGDGSQSKAKQAVPFATFYGTLPLSTELKSHHSTLLEVLFPMISFFARVKIFRFWPKTMDYNKAF